MGDAEAAPTVDAPPCSGLALVAYVCGLFPTGPIALPLGILAWRAIRRGERVGRPVAYGAMALGVLWIVGLTFLVCLRVTSGAGVYESAALDELRAIRQGQQAFRAAAAIDADHDGRGEYADFRQLGGRFGVSGTFRTVEASGVTRKYTYLFRCYLPLGVNPRETDYLVYAWPESHGHPCVRAFLLDGRTGHLWHCSNATHIAGRYSGTERQPLAGAAFSAARSPGGWPAPTTRPGVDPADGEDWALLE